jgi:nucleoside-diphosphate-sugar epimerase
MSTKGTVLISGINGYIASRTAETLLEAGYSIRGTVRSLSSAKGLQHVFKVYVEAGKLSVVEVPDITKNGAFDEAVKGTPHLDL